MTSFQYLAISEIIESGKPSKNKEREKYWSINLDQIESHTGKVTSWEFLNIDEIGPSTHFFEKGTVLYSKLRPYLNKVVLADRDGYATTELVPIRCNVKIALPEYVAYFLRSPNFLKFAENLVAGAKMPRMVMSEFWKYKIPVPSLAEQHRIAAILDKAEALRAKRREAIAKLDQLLQSVFLEMFGDPLLNNKSLKIFSLSEISDFENGDRSSNYPSGNDITTSGIPFISTKNIVSNEFSPCELKFISDEKFKTLSRGKAFPGDLLITLRGTLGNVCIYEGFDSPAFINAQMMIIRCNEKIVKNDFIHSFLTTQRIQDFLQNEGTGAAVPQLTSKFLGSIKIPVPLIEIQEEFIAKKQEINGIKKFMVTSLENSEKLIKSLQEKLFN